MKIAITFFSSKKLFPFPTRAGAGARWELQKYVPNKSPYLTW